MPGITSLCFRLIQQFPQASGCPKCKAAFSLVEGGTVIPAHAGPTNTRLRAHLGLVVPKKGDVHMRIANRTVTWKPGKVGRQLNIHLSSYFLPVDDN